MLRVETLSFFIIPVGIAEISTSLYGWLSSGGSPKRYIAFLLQCPTRHSTLHFPQFLTRTLSFDPSASLGVEPSTPLRLDYPQDREPVEPNLANKYTATFCLSYPLRFSIRQAHGAECDRRMRYTHFATSASLSTRASQ